MIVILDAGTLGDLELTGLSEDAKIFRMTSSSQVIERCREATVIVTNKVVLNSHILERLPKLKGIVIMATGLNNVDLDYCTKNNIEVLNAKGYSTDSVVSLTFSMAFYFLQDLSHYRDFIESKQWIGHEFFTYFKDFHQLSSKSWTIVGLGTIGERVAKIASAFGCDVSYVSTSGKNNRDDYRQVTLDKALNDSDIISIHAPLNEKTKNLITLEKLKKLKNGAILLNLGRGGIINEKDLSAFLSQEKEIKVGLDVLESEPMRNSCPLISQLKNPNLLITPHIAWASKESRENLWKMTIENINRVLALN